MRKLLDLLPGGRWLWLVILALLSLSGRARAEEKISEEAKLYFRNGVELIQANPPNYQDAYYQFKLAYEKSRSWKVLGNLGLCALKLERDGEALDFYNEYLRSGGKDVDAEERKALERDTLLISGNTAVVNLTSSSADAELIDARTGSSVSPQPYRFVGGALTLRLRAGSHVLTATSSDGKHEKWEVTVTPGRTLEHRFEFAAPPPAAAPPPVPAQPAPVAPPPEQPKSGGSTLRTAGFVTAGVGAAALVGGVITGVMARSAETDATGSCDSDNVCPERAEDDFDSAASLATVTNVLLIGGGVLAAAGVGMIVFGGGGGGEKPASALRAPHLRLTPLVARGGAGLFATGAF
ncbi:MAG TPA: hypothetical protein VGK73_33070 [Polyangiaceae bacterium]